jgi:glucose/arabinose dehydrogenase
LPSGFTEAVMASNLSSPTALEFSPDGRLFVAEQGGTLEVWQNGARLQANFFQQTPLTVDSSGEGGLLGLAFDPGYATNRHVYAYYTATAPTVHNRLSRFTANATGDLALPGTEKVILELDPLGDTTFHSGGAIHFGPDGKLYIAVGDNLHSENAQSLTSLKGKLLRLNPDGTIPPDNPFFNDATPGARKEIWALGLRNPFTFAIQPGSGRIFINDVGEGEWEEVNDGLAASNFGWPHSEGPRRPSDPPTTIGTYRDPFHAYRHMDGVSGDCAITAGVFYNPAVPQFPTSYTGKYFFADFCGGSVRVLDPADRSVTGFATGIPSPVGLVVGPDGSLHYLERGAGRVFRVWYTPNQAPGITQQPANQTVSVGQPATFTVAASGTLPLSYQWQRDGVNIAGATSASYTLAAATLADNGATFRAVVSNVFGAATSTAATLTVTTNRPPTALITAPAVGTLFSGGEIIAYAGTATDDEDGPLPASAFTWKVDFHHDDHVHPFLPATSGATGGSFTVSTIGHTDANIWYRIHLTVKDSGGLTHTTFRDVAPRLSTLTLATNPAGLQVTLDGQPRTGPSAIVGVVGITRTLGVVSPQTVGGVTYEFVSWSDGGAATHTITTPPTASTFTALYRALPAGPGLSATYYDNIDFTGSIVRRIDPTVDFEWDWGQPDPGIGPDTFSVRWEGLVQAQFNETYTFYTDSDDGIRLWVNGQLLIDNWTDHPPTEDSGTISLAAGQRYALRLEFYENLAGATARLLWSSPSTPKAVIPTSQLFTTNGVGAPLITQQPSDRTVNVGQPVTFAVAASGTAPLTYQWQRNGTNIQGATSPTYTIPAVTVADHGATFRVIVSNAIGSVTSTAARLTVNTGGGNGLSATYYDNIDFSGPTLGRIDPTVDFGWGTDAPADGIDGDTFSVRWQGQVQPEFSETYTFYTDSDDGVRLWINGQLLVDNWTDHAPTEDSGTITLTAGQMYSLRLEFYENLAGATARLLWSSPSTPKNVIPQSRLFTTSGGSGPGDGLGGEESSTEDSGGSTNSTPLGGALWTDLGTPGSAYHALGQVQAGVRVPANLGVGTDSLRSDPLTSSAREKPEGGASARRSSLAKLGPVRRGLDPEDVDAFFALYTVFGARLVDS